MKFFYYSNNSIVRVTRFSALSIILLITTFQLCFSHNIAAREILKSKVTLSTKNETLRNVIKQLNKQTQGGFVYSSKSDLPKIYISLKVKDREVSSVLNEILPHNLTYEMVENKIVIKNTTSGQESVNFISESTKLTEPFNELINASKDVVVKGQVTDAKGETLIGVSVKIKGTNVGVTTDINGRYSLTLPKGNDILIFTYVGFVMQEVAVNNRETVNLVLIADAKSLEEVVVVGYGTQRKENLTGSVASVNSEKLTIAPMANTTNALIGLLPGLFSKQSSGMPGSDAANINIRNFGNALIIVDGIESSFNDIDANQIESISILKDASASIYGARAGNGVILVTTKRGKNQKPTITLNSSYTNQGVTKMIHPASSGQRAEMEREAYIQSGQPAGNAPWSEEDITKFFAGKDSAYPNTDWFNYVFRSYAPQQNHNLSVRGGSEKIKYFGFFGYTDQKTMIKRNGGDFSRYNVQSNVDATITKNLNVSMNLSIGLENRLFPARGLGYTLWQDYYTTMPWYPAVLPDPSKIPWGGIDVGSIATTSNMDLMGYSLNKGSDLRGTISLDYNIESIRGLKAKARINYSDNTSFGKGFSKPIEFYTYSPSTKVYTQSASFPQSTIGESMGRSNVLTQQYSLNYDNTFNKIHHISALAMFEGMNYHSDNFSASRSNLLSSAIDQLFIGSTIGMGNNGSASEMGRASYIGRVNYSLMDRYLIETTLRADASAKFPADRRWGYFPSVSLGWRMSQEGFLKNISGVDNLKLRASYGQSGNDAVGNFQYLSGYAIRGNAILDDQAQPGIFVTGLANPFLTWEKMTIYNVGFDFSFLNRKIYGTVDAFHRNRNGIPATRILSLPTTFGSSLPPENLNSMDNRGFELMLGTYTTISDFSYDISGNISFSRGKWNHFEEPNYTDPDQKRISQVSGRFTDLGIGYTSDGLFTSQDQINKLKYTYPGGNSSLRPGDVIYKDLNGDGILDWKDQKETSLGTLPLWTYALDGTFKYKNFDLTGLFQGAFGYNTRVNFTTYPNVIEYKLRWTPINNDPNALIPRLGGSNTNNYASDYNYKSTSYIRLKVVSLGYNVPQKTLEKVGIGNLKLYFSGTNLFTVSSLSKYGVDPESPSGLLYYPLQRTFSLGINLSF